VLPTFPGRPAGDDDRETPAGERVSDIEIGHAVKPQLEEVGIGHLIATAAQQGHRRRGHRDAQSTGHGCCLEAHINMAVKSKKKPLQPVRLKRLDLVAR
jgi:hypothetical protein